MIWEILLSFYLKSIVHQVFKAISTLHNSKEKTISVHGELRELGLLEEYFHRNHIENGYFISSAAVVNSKTSLDNSKVTKCLEILAKRHPILQAGIREVDYPDGIHYYFIKMPFFKVEYQQSDKLATEPTHWEDTMSKALLIPLNYIDGPLWRCCRLKECSDTKTDQITNCFVFSFHHAIIDGFCRTKLFQEFLDILDILHKDQHVEDIVHNLRPSCETLLGDKVCPEWWQRLKAIIVEPLFKRGLYSLKSNKVDMYFRQYPVVINVDPSVRQENRAILTSLSKAETNTLVSACKQHGCTISGALSAAANMALAEILQNGTVTQPQWIPSLYAVSSRRDMTSQQYKNIDYLGACVAEAKLSCTVPPYDSLSFTSVFWKLSTGITHNVRKTVESGAYLSEIKLYLAASRELFQNGMHARVWSHHGGRFGDRLFFVSNVGRFEETSGRMFNLEKIFLMYGSHTEGHLFDIFVTTINGTMCISFTYYPHVTKRSQAEDFNSKLLHNLKLACSIDQ